MPATMTTCTGRARVKKAPLPEVTTPHVHVPRSCSIALGEVATIWMTGEVEIGLARRTAVGVAAGSCHAQPLRAKSAIICRRQFAGLRELQHF